jgi:hypothetical protein
MIIFNIKLTQTETPNVNHKGRIHFLLCSLHKNKLVKKKKMIMEELIKVNPRKKSFKTSFLKRDTPETISVSK